LFRQRPKLGGPSPPKIFTCVKMEGPEPQTTTRKLKKDSLKWPDDCEIMKNVLPISEQKLAVFGGGEGVEQTRKKATTKKKNDAPGMEGTYRSNEK